MSLEGLPNEILDCIIRSLMEEQYRNPDKYPHPTLALTKCSKRLYMIGIRSLYKSVVATNYQMLRLFIKTIITCPKLAILVSCVNLCYYDTDPGRWSPEKPNGIRDWRGLHTVVLGINEADMPEFLARNPPLENVARYLSRNPSSWSLVSLSITLLPSLKELYIPEVNTEGNDISLYPQPFIATPWNGTQPQNGSFIAVNNLFIKRVYGLRSMMHILSLPYLQTITVQSLITLEFWSNRTGLDNSTLLQLNITNGKSNNRLSIGYVPSRRLIMLLTRLKALETFRYEEPWPRYGDSGDGMVFFSDIIGGISHLKHCFKDLTLFLGNHVQRSGDFLILDDFVKLEHFEIGVSSLLQGMKNGTFSVVGPKSSHTFPYTVKTLGMNCRDINEFMWEPIQKLVEMMASSGTLRVIELKYLPGHVSHSFASHSECGILERYPWLAELCVKCLEHGVNLRIC